MTQWTVSGFDWGVTDEASRSPGHSLTDSPGGQYAFKSDVAVATVGTFDLNGATAPAVVFWHRLDLNGGQNNAWYTPHGDWIVGDAVFVEVSKDLGLTWEQLAKYNYGNNVSTWSVQQFGLAKYVGQRIKLRFRLMDDKLQSDAVADGWYIDDVEIRELT